MENPKLTGESWLEPKAPLARATHLISACSECYEIICVEKAKSKEDIEKQTRASLNAAFQAHIKARHPKRVHCNWIQ
jgi:hypothetical protein